MAQRDRFSTIKLEGSLLTYDLLKQVISNEASDISPDGYGLPPGEKINEAISRDWDKALKYWQGFQNSLEQLSPDDPATTVTRERWLLPLFSLLGYGRLQPARNMQAQFITYSISHRFASTPIHMLGCRTKLDQRTAGQKGAARMSPHSLVQDFLNKNDQYLWGIVTNGHSLRILRDNANVARMTYLEFNLLAMMDTQAYSDFALLWMVIHASRFELRNNNVEDCIIESWSKSAQDNGVRALETLRIGVESALRTFGNGFLSNPDNTKLISRIQTNNLSKQQFLEQLMRLVYRLIFLFVAEDRDLLLLPLTIHTAEARARYEKYYSTTDLRQKARIPRGSQHSDQWEWVKVIMGLLEAGYEPLALPALGSFLWSKDAILDLAESNLANSVIQLALRQLCWTETSSHTLMAVDWKNLGSEELGSIYESLLEYIPNIHIGAENPFELVSQAGNERKTTGSYYTPTQLILSLLDSALVPVMKNAIQGKATFEAKEAILSLKVCDPSCGSGHFLVAAAHRLARLLAILETGDDEPAPEALRAALRQVIARCIYGVDINPMSVELCKVALWMESMEQGKPLSFLDHHIKCGNSLIGATPKLISEGIPDEAFNPITGDDKEFCKAMKKTNREYRRRYCSREQSFFTAVDSGISNSQWRSMTDILNSIGRSSENTLDEVRNLEDQYQNIVNSPSWQHAKLVADAWCTSYTQVKTRSNNNIIDESRFSVLKSNPSRASADQIREIREQANQYRFFHWHLEFVDVFKPTDDITDSNCGWSSGFDVVLGNPPWDKVQMEEVPWFSQYDTSISSARTGADRKRLIERLKESNPALYGLFEETKRHYDSESRFLRMSNRYPLSAQGRINTYTVFSDLFSKIIGEKGRAGFIVPSGIATDMSSSEFFGDLAEKGQILSLYAFENKKKIFPAVHAQYRFCLLTLTGCGSPVNEADYAFFLEAVSDLSDDQRHFTMSGSDLGLFNPNTGNCPTFRSKRDKEIANKIYSKCPVLIKDGRNDQPDENPWGIRFMQMFNMTSDSHLFWTKEKLVDHGWMPVSNRWTKNGQWMVPLYEGKMFYLFDHRYATFEGATESQLNSGQLPKLTDEEHTDPWKLPLPQYWVEYIETKNLLDSSIGGVICFRDIARATDQRTMIDCVAPWTAFGNKAPLLILKLEYTKYTLVLASILNSYVFDYIARMSVGGTSMNFYIVKQLPVISLSTLVDELEIFKLLNECSLELIYSSWDLYPWIKNQIGKNYYPFKWDVSRRQKLEAIINAVVAYLFGLDLADLEHILDSFDSIKNEDISRNGKYIIKDEILNYFNHITKFKNSSYDLRNIIDPAPGSIVLCHELSDLSVAEAKMPWIDWKTLSGNPDFNA